MRELGRLFGFLFKGVYKGYYKGSIRVVSYRGLTNYQSCFGNLGLRLLGFRLLVALRVQSLGFSV